jgi:DnaJ-class molecular chaperone
MKNIENGIVGPIKETYKPCPDCKSGMVKILNEYDEEQLKTCRNCQGSGEIMVQE